MNPVLRFSIFLFLFPLLGIGQDRAAYSDDFQFKDGIYLSFRDFKNNNPIPITHIYSELDIRAEDYLQQVMDADSVIYYDNLLEERIVSTKSIWGYASHNRIHIGFNTVEGSDDWRDRDWFPIITIGAYSYFTAVSMVTRYMPPTPGMGMQPRGTLLDDGAFYNNNGSYYQEPVSVQLLLDFKDGSLIPLGTGDLTTASPNLLYSILSSDATLLQEYEELNRRDQKQSSMYYIRRYNERNPIYFPL